MSSRGSRPSGPNPPGGCSQYRQEMVLVGLKKRLASQTLTEEERRGLEEEIHRMEEQMGF